ncbi:hypothetical protein C9374_005557 [Naegleria lovaniensis]|uniref:DOMON domain-containing protein n=1 Tax=Naegleria lovaniensis TaxID=51637 RepID=A0AA88KK73_NAELO|nr:uncharacterized protein C9374_005557 [Naegleria lovaniensis]KAG2382355.1 hypothetical protein C9374_005557 [Naegleria lovaniensis]
MTSWIVSPFLLLILFFSAIVSAQNTTLPTLFENCYVFRSKSSSDVYRVEWTLDEPNDRFSARFTLPSAPGYGSIGFKLTNQGYGMPGSTILLGYGNGIVNEYYANGNTQPSKLTNNQFLAAASSTVGNVTTLTYVRTLTRPAGAPNTYFAFPKNANVTLLFASSLKSPVSPTSFLQHYRADLYSGGINFYMKNVNACISTGGAMSVYGWNASNMSFLVAIVSSLCIVMLSSLL